MPGLDHKNSEYWENPENFAPERFLDPKGKFIAQKEGFQPFGIGKNKPQYFDFEYLIFLKKSYATKIRLDFKYL